MPVVTAAAAPSTGGGTEDASATAVDVKATATNMDTSDSEVMVKDFDKTRQLNTDTSVLVFLLTIPVRTLPGVDHLLFPL